MTAVEQSARRYSRRCRQKQRIQQQRRRRLCSAIALTVALISVCLCYLSGCNVGANNVGQAPEVLPTEDVVLIVDSTPEPVRHRDDIVSDGRLLSYELQEVMQDCCEQYSVPYALALAMAEVESHFDPDAVSSTGDYGLMQINTINHAWLLEKGIDVKTYEGNIEAGIYIISGYLQTYEDTEKALMAYNCGPTGARRLWEAGTYQTNYTRKVMAAYEYWTNLLEG
jgi:hypothetical protein